MKKFSILFVSLAFITTLQVSAQKAFNVEIGGNIANTYKNAYTLKPISNYSFGISWDTPINDMLFLRIGAGFAQDSKEEKEDYTWVKTEKLYSISNFELPVTVGYRKELGKLVVSAQGGLFLSKHLSGTSNSIITNDSNLVNPKIERKETIWFGKDNSDWKKTDFGFIVKAGVEYKNFELGIAYAMGLMEQTHKSGVVYRPMEVWPTTTTHELYDYGITPEAVKRLTITLSYRFELGESKAKTE